MSNGRLRACRVVLPGAVIRLKSAPEEKRLAAAMASGLGEHWDRGYGCVLPHPGKARRLYRRKIVSPSIGPTSHADDIRKGLEFAGKTELSASQIAGLLSQIGNDGKAIKEFLERQKRRGSRAWASWNSSYEELKRMAEKPAAMKIQLEVARDLIVAGREQ